MKSRIAEINEEIKSLKKETNNEIEKLSSERDKLIEEQHPIHLEPYIKVIDNKGNESVLKITRAYHDDDTGEIFAYIGKFFTYKGFPLYHPDFYLNLYDIKEWNYISEVEFEELLTKGLDLIRKDII